ncbi:MrfF [Siccibacter turicensis]|uniref:MrfF n=1 Tax=Siccibacter turicensis TaxID=357233 RepID=UPI002A6B4B3A|nr:MrfF [Siccibacter turicensis]MDY0969681.1 MrfF [Siccibacter turicensis]
MKKRRLLPTACLIALLQIMLISPESTFANTMNINISGVVIANGSCTFTQGDALQIDFGEVKLQPTGPGVVKLDGNYLKPLASDFSCSGDSAGLLQMRFISSSGNYSTYNGIKVLAVDKGIVAVQLRVNGTAKNMGDWFDVDPASPPSLQAEIVQISTSNANNVVSGDAFTANGTLVMAFN